MEERKCSVLAVPAAPVSNKEQGCWELTLGSKQDAWFGEGVPKFCNKFLIYCIVLSRPPIPKPGARGFCPILLRPDNEFSCSFSSMGSSKEQGAENLHFKWKGGAVLLQFREVKGYGLLEGPWGKRKWGITNCWKRRKAILCTPGQEWLSQTWGKCSVFPLSSLCPCFSFNMD